MTFWVLSLQCGNAAAVSLKFDMWFQVIGFVVGHTVAKVFWFTAAAMIERYSYVRNLQNVSTMHQIPFSMLHLTKL